MQRAATFRSVAILVGCLLVGAANLHAWFAVQRLAADPGILSYMDFGKGDDVFSTPVFVLLLLLLFAWLGTIFYGLLSDRRQTDKTEERVWASLFVPVLLILGSVSTLVLAKALHSRSDILGDGALLVSALYPLVALLLWGYSAWRMRQQWLSRALLLVYAVLAGIPSAVVFSIATRL